MPNQLVQTIKGVDFLKFRPYDLGLCRLVIWGTGLELGKGCKHATLGECEGYKALIKLRNDAGLEREEPDMTPVQAGMAKLFGNAAAIKKQPKPARVNATQLRALREDPQLFEFTLPGPPSLLVTAVRPIHPCDEVAAQAGSGHS